MEANHFDIAIIGAGPAGAVLAMLLGRLGKHTVALADSRRLDGPLDGESPKSAPEKSCGGLVAPDAQKILSRLGLSMPNSLLADPQIFSVRTIDLETGLIRHYQRFYINTHRPKFDRWLASGAIAHPNITPYFGCKVTDIQRDNGLWRVSLDGKTITAPVVVGADGACSLLRRRLFPTAKTRRYSSVQHIFPKTDGVEEAYFYALFHRKITDYYAWALPKDDHFLLGAAIPAGQSARQSFARLRETLEKQGFTLGEPLKEEGTLILRPRGWLPARQIAKADGSAYLIGEAAGFISPSSAEGISFAMASAAALYAALKVGVSSPKTASLYGAHTLPLRGKLLIKQLKCPFMYHPLLRRLVMASGLQAHDLIE